MCFCEDLKIYSGLWPLSASPRCQCVYTMAGQPNSTAAELAEFRKITTFFRKNTIFNEHPVFPTLEFLSSRSWLRERRKGMTSLIKRRYAKKFYDAKHFYNQPLSALCSSLPDTDRSNMLTFSRYSDTLFNIVLLCKQGPFELAKRPLQITLSVLPSVGFNVHMS